MKILRWKFSPLTRFLSLFSKSAILSRLRSLNRDAAIDSMRNVLAVLGVSTLLGDFARLSWYLYLPGVAFLCLVWYMDYLRHEFDPIQAALDNASAARAAIDKFRTEGSVA